MTAYKQGVNTDGELIRDFYVEHDPVELDASHDGRTRQEFKDECDINVLMAGYERNGVFNWFNPTPPSYLDVSAVPDMAQALSIFDKAQEAFMSLPANVRRQFDQDPLLFLEFAQQPANLAKMREWGLAPPAPEPPPVPVAPVSDPPKSS